SACSADTSGISTLTNRYLAAAILGGTNCMRRSYLWTLGTAILLFTILAAEKTNAMQYQERSSDEASTLSTQAAAAVDSHHYSEAVDLLERVVALRPDDAQTRYKLGRVLQNQERFIESIAAFRQALRLDPNFADAYHALGVSYNTFG